MTLSYARGTLAPDCRAEQPYPSSISPEVPERSGMYPRCQGLHLVREIDCILTSGTDQEVRPYNCRYIYIPPFTASTWPVMYDASSLARNLTAAAMSSGVPMRASGILPMMVCFSSSGKSLVISVET